jgi:hypothetical protein
MDRHAVGMIPLLSDDDAAAWLGTAVPPFRPTRTKPQGRQG